MKIKRVTIIGKGYKLAGTLVAPFTKPKIKLPAVIFYHGMVSQSKPRYVKRAKELAKKGIIGFCFDFRGCGESDGRVREISLADWLNDALLTFDFLVKQPFVDSQRIGISGKSFGGYIAALVSEKRKAKSMVFQAPAVYADNWFEVPYKLSSWHDNEYATQRRLYRHSNKAFDNKAIRAIKKFINPLLVVGSELDDTVPREIVKGYYNACPSKTKKILWIKGADHPLINEKYNKQYTQLMVDWFKQTL